MRDRLLLAVAIGFLASALVTALPVVPHGRPASTATAAPAEAHVRVDVSLPAAGALGGVALSVVLMAGLLVSLQRSPARHRRSRGLSRL